MVRQAKARSRFLVIANLLLVVLLVGSASFVTRGTLFARSTPVPDNAIVYDGRLIHYGHTIQGHQIEVSAQGRASVYLVRTSSQVLSGAHVDVDVPFLGFQSTLSEASAGIYSLDLDEHASVVIGTTAQSIGDWQATLESWSLNGKHVNTLSFTDYVSQANLRADSGPMSYSIPFTLTFDVALHDSGGHPIANTPITLTLPNHNYSETITTDGSGRIHYQRQERIRLTVSGGSFVTLASPMAIPGASALPFIASWPNDSGGGGGEPTPTPLPKNRICLSVAADRATYLTNDLVSLSGKVTDCAGSVAGGASLQRSIEGPEPRASGGVSLGSDGSFDDQEQFDTPGTYTARFTATNSDGDSATQALTFEVVSLPTDRVTVSPLAPGGGVSLPGGTYAVYHRGGAIDVEVIIPRQNLQDGVQYTVQAALHHVTDRTASPPTIEASPALVEQFDFSTADFASGADFLRHTITLQLSGTMPVGYYSLQVGLTNPNAAQLSIGTASLAIIFELPADPAVQMRFVARGESVFGVEQWGTVFDLALDDPKVFALALDAVNGTSDQLSARASILRRVSDMMTWTSSWFENGVRNVLELCDSTAPASGCAMTDNNGSAALLTAFLRTVGIPARIVVGGLGDDLHISIKAPLPGSLAPGCLTHWSWTEALAPDGSWHVLYPIAGGLDSDRRSFGANQIGALCEASDLTLGGVYAEGTDGSQEDLLDAYGLPLGGALDLGTSPNDNVGIAAVLGRGNETDAGASGASWDRVPFAWHEMQPQGQPLNVSIYDQKFQTTPMAHTLGILTSRAQDGVKIAQKCVDSVRSGNRSPTYWDGVADNSHAGLCVTYTGYTYDYQTGVATRNGDLFLANGQPNPANPWATFVYQTSHHYADKIDAWEIFNETESGFESGYDFNLGKDTSTKYFYLPPPKLYALLIKDALSILDRTNPGKPVVLGGALAAYIEAMVSQNSSDPSWYAQSLQELLSDPVVAGKLIIGLHVYGRPYNSYLYLRTIRQHFPAISSVWFTEAGVRDIGSLQLPSNGQCDKPCGYSDQAASYVVQNYVWVQQGFREQGLSGKLFHYNFKDIPPSEVNNKNDNGWGLIDESTGATRPDYRAFQVITHLLNAATLRSFDDQANYVRATFDAHDPAGRPRTVTVMWAKTSASPTIPVPAAAQEGWLYDQNGVFKRYLRPNNGAYQLSLPPATHPCAETETRGCAPQSSSDERMIGGTTLILIERPGTSPHAYGAASPAWGQAAAPAAAPTLSAAGAESSAAASGPAALRVSVRAPERVIAGQRFQVHALVWNPGGEALSGVTLALSNDAAAQAALETDAQQQLASLAPGGWTEVAWTLRAQEPGRYHTGLSASSGALSASTIAGGVVAEDGHAIDLVIDNVGDDSAGGTRLRRVPIIQGANYVRASYAVQLQNESALTDTLTVFVQPPARRGMAAFFEVHDGMQQRALSRTITLAPHTTAELALELTALSQETMVQVVAYSQRDRTLTEIMTARLERDDRQLLHLDPERVEPTIQHGQRDTTTLQLTNDGDAALSDIALTPHGDIAAWLHLSSTHIDTLAPGETLSVPLEIAVPRYQPPGTYDGSIEARSGSYSDLSGVRVTVPESHAATVAITPEHLAVVPGNTALYSARVQNEGNVSDSYNLSLSGIPTGWEVNWERNPVVLEPGAAADVRLLVIPTRAPTTRPASYTLSVTAANADASTTAQASLEVLPFHAVDLNIDGTLDLPGPQIIVTKIWKKIHDLKGRVDVIILTRGIPTASDESALVGRGATIRRRFTIVNAIAANVPAAKLTTIAGLPFVDRIDLDEAVAVVEQPSAQVGTLNVGGLRSGGFDGSGVVVAVVDTGVDMHHAALPHLTGGYDFVNNDADPTDDNGHGSHVAGIIGSNDPSAPGVAPGATIMPVKVLDSSGAGSTSTVIAGIEWAVNHGANEINLSLGTSGAGDGSSALSVAVDNAVKSGVVVIVAAGNAGPTYQSVGSPGDANLAITVGALDTPTTVASFSSRGPTLDGRVKPDILAPGVNIVSTWMGGGFQTKSGTSMATPHVAGVGALLLDAYSTTPALVKEALTTTAVLLPGYDRNTQGQGRVDGDAAAAYIRERLATASARSLPGATVVYTYTLANLGNVVDSFRLSVQADPLLNGVYAYPSAIPSSWVLLPSASGTLDASARRSAAARIAVPADWAGMEPAVYRFRLTATSQADGSVDDTELGFLSVQPTKRSKIEYSKLEIGWLRGDVVALPSGSGPLGSLDAAAAKVQSALDGLIAGDLIRTDTSLDTATNEMSAFVSAVQAQRGNQIDAATADQLLAQAQTIISHLRNARLTTVG